MAHRRWLLAFAVVALLAQMGFAMVTAAVEQSPTIDEPVYVGAAVVYTHEHSLRYNPEHPPLGKLIMAIGLAFGEVRYDPTFDGTQGDFGQRLLYGSGNDAARLLLLARLPIIVLTMLFGFIVYRFAAELVGSAAALVALALYAFSPDVIANGSLATLDVLWVGFLLTSVWLVWRARERPWRYLPLAALALGAALATKMSALPAVPLILALAVLSVLHGQRLAVALAAALGVAAVAIAVVWVSYLVVDPYLRFTPPDQLTPGGVREVGGIRALVVHALPFPEPYRVGMRMQFGFEDARFGGYLFGNTYAGSRWYYLPAALLVKTPLGMLALWLAGTVAMLAVPRLRPAAPYLLGSTAVLLAAAMLGDRDFGTRYAIFMPMFLAVVASAVTAVGWRWVPFATAALVAFVAVSSLRTFPYYLPYSNEAFGGPSKTYLRLHDSNVDWGQDLGRLGERLRDRYPGQRVWLVYKGSGVPSYYGIEAGDPRTVPPDEVRGLLVVSNTSIVRADPPLEALIATSTRIDDVGHSITIFRR
jgi:4-amino-4-deoxy-L-arabinose transferase-like glycosyltransferase